ncbi:hypothetical protein [Actinoplanes sp. NPDC020271]|uniref:hypothetical protein n=1 Tax=Actinoplanes sp. NPDC020271 TaxID=3363896 RepID=UPI0037989049
MNSVPQTLLSDSMAPMVIWMMLMVAAVPAVVLLASPHAVHRPGRLLMTILDVLRCHIEVREQARRDALAALRRAELARVAVTRAGVVVEQRRVLWCEAGQHTDEMWLAWQAAEQRVGRARAATAFAAPWAARTATEYTDWARALHRRVSSAVARGDLPAAAVAAVSSGRDGWNRSLHPVEQELTVLRAIADHRRQRHAQAGVAERAARDDLRHVAAIRDRLRAEAVVAARAAAEFRLRPAVEHWTVRALRLTWVHRLA